MKLVIKDTKIIATATDAYDGPEFFIQAPEGFDVNRLSDYSYINNVLIEKPETDRLEEKIFALWSSADKYTSNYISGVAVGILTIGVLQQLPKAMAVNNWSRSIWTEYYIRKSQVTISSVDNHDFSSFGPMPHTVPELQEEIGL